MNKAEYIANQLGEDRLKELVRNGLISPQVMTMLEVYQWHVTHGKKREITAEYFKITKDAVSYAVKIMNQSIR